MGTQQKLMLPLLPLYPKNQKVVKDFERFLEKCEDQVQAICRMKKGTIIFTECKTKDQIFFKYYSSLWSQNKLSSRVYAKKNFIQVCTKEIQNNKKILWLFIIVNHYDIIYIFLGSF